MNARSYTALLSKFTEDSYLTTKQLSHVCRVSFFYFQLASLIKLQYYING